MSDHTEHRLTKLESQGEHVIEKLNKIEKDLQPITKHVLTLNALFKISTSAVAILLMKKIMGL